MSTAVLDPMHTCKASQGTLSVHLRLGSAASGSGDEAAPLGRSPAALASQLRAPLFVLKVCSGVLKQVPMVAARVLVPFEARCADRFRDVSRTYDILNTFLDSWLRLWKCPVKPPFGASTSGGLRSCSEHFGLATVCLSPNPQSQLQSP